MTPLCPSLPSFSPPLTPIRCIARTRHSSLPPFNHLPLSSPPVYSLPSEQRIEAMKLIANMFPFDGDLAGTSAPLDPLFWVTLGSVERLYQKSVFSNAIFSDMDYQQAEDYACSGHEANEKKAWLQGLDFGDATVSADQLNTEELMRILNPTRYPLLFTFLIGNPLIYPIHTPNPINALDHRHPPPCQNQNPSLDPKSTVINTNLTPTESYFTLTYPH